MEPILSLISVAIGSSGLSAIVIAILNHHWAKKKNSSGKLDALVEAQKVLMIDRVRYLGSSYIHEGEISLEDKENLTEMYQAYKSLGGNGHLSTIMSEVERLHIVAGIRAIKTMAETAIATIGAAAVLSAVEWTVVLSATILSGILSLLVSIKGLPEVEKETANKN